MSKDEALTSWISVEYVWVDSGKSHFQIRSKKRFIQLSDDPDIDDLPDWDFDALTGFQGRQSGGILVPARLYKSPFESNGFIVLCEVNDAADCPHPGNHRVGLQSLVTRSDQPFQVDIGFEQNYRLVDVDQEPGLELGVAYPGWAENTFCVSGAGTATAQGRTVAEEHAQACLAAGVHLRSWNLGYERDWWSFYIGKADKDAEPADVMAMADDLWVARFILGRISEKYGKSARYEFSGPLGSLATTLSTKQTRSKHNGIEHILILLDKLEIQECLDKVGNEFKQQFHRSEEYALGYSSRDCALYIPNLVLRQGYGAFVDCRPRSGADPYRIAQYLIGCVLVSNDHVAGISEMALEQPEQLDGNSFN